ncbi:putative membrane protein [Streptococcus mitis]|uniref:Putative membrane protein n=1 Tax=Streptococcus mitis TaxID=28037 RepID=A0A081PUZ9_STRMT|nr:putative membrane protein [Streptococcus mitis]
MNRSLVGEFFIIFLILLTISFWFSIWKLEKALDNDSQ